MVCPRVGTVFDMKEILCLFVGIDLGWLGNDMGLRSI